MKQLSPEIDRLAGIEYYSTSFKGIKGTIKKTPDDFNVKELIDSDFLKRLVPQKTNNNSFPVYKIEKMGIDSNHAIITIRKKLGLNLKIVGIKDAKATTTQYASTINNKRIIQNVRIGTISLTFVGYSQKPLEKSLLVGNKFKIKISDLKENSNNGVILSSFLAEMNNLANYYGLQRFGSERLVTHLVGKAILTKNFNKAIELLLTHTTKYDSKFSREIREKLVDVKNNPNLIKIIPKGMDIEKNIATEIVKGKEPIAILRAIPINIRRLFVQAFQAFIFNKTLSKAIENNLDLLSCEKDDLCFEVYDNLVFGKIRKYENLKSNNYNNNNNTCKNIPIIRLPGHSFHPSKNRFDTITKEVLNSENISSKDFLIKEIQELSEPGGFRQAAFICKDFFSNISNNGVVVEFSIPKGSYATTLLRELIKPMNPIDSGF